MIKVPGSDKQNNRHQAAPLLDDSFDPTRDDWSRHEDGAGRHHSDGLGYHDGDEESPSWFEEDDDQGHSGFEDLRRIM